MMDIQIIVTTVNGGVIYKVIGSACLSEEVPIVLSRVINKVGMRNIRHINFSNNSNSFTLDRILMACSKGIQIVCPSLVVEENAS